MESRKAGEGIVFSRKSSDFFLHRDHDTSYNLMRMIIAGEANREAPNGVKLVYLGILQKQMRHGGGWGIRDGDKPNCDPPRGAILASCCWSSEACLREWLPWPSYFGGGVLNVAFIGKHDETKPLSVACETKACRAFC